jgi:hypothetical protein
LALVLRKPQAERRSLTVPVEIAPKAATELVLLWQAGGS